MISRSEEDTILYAGDLAKDIKRGDIFLLSGDLGAGKSVLARALIRNLTADPDMNVPSPTFTLVQTYDTPQATIWHFDLYRLEEPEDVYELGWEDALSGGIVLVEWPERLGPLTPKQARTITITIDPTTGARDICVESRPNKEHTA